MPINFNCTNKGCYKYNEALLDLKDNKVYCSECGEEINNVSSFAKAQMKNFKQVKKNIKKSFSVPCIFCKADERPELIDDLICCANCKKELKVDRVFKQILLDKLKNISDEI